MEGIRRERARKKLESTMSRALLDFAPAATPKIGGLRAWTVHLWAFVLPLVNFVFLVTGPHAWWSALVWTTPVWILVLIDNRNIRDHRQPPEDLPNWPFDLQ